MKKGSNSEGGRLMEGVSVEAIQEGGRLSKEGGGGVEPGQSNLCLKTRPGGQRWG